MIVMRNHGSIVLMEPDESDLVGFAGWVAENVGTEGQEVMFYGDALCVEPRYAGDLASGLESDGFEVVLP